MTPLIQTKELTVMVISKIACAVASFMLPSALYAMSQQVSETGITSNSPVALGLIVVVGGSVMVLIWRAGRLFENINNRLEKIEGFVESFDDENQPNRNREDLRRRRNQ